jgi:thiol-disulfide isomerase/thioredoxin
MWPLRKIFTGTFLMLAGTMGLRAEWHTGDAFPQLDRWDLAGGARPVTAGQVVLVDFWASWCAPCKASFPIYAQLHKDYSPQGLVILAVSVDENPAAYAGFLKKLNPPFFTLHDQHQQLVREAKVPVMPTSYLFGRDGRLRFIHQGFHGKATEEEMRREIESLLKEKA